MASGSEQRLSAFFNLLQAQLPVGVSFSRNATLPSRIPPSGWVCLRDGDPGAPAVLLSPPLYVYDHVAEIDVVVDAASDSARDSLFDALKVAIGNAIAIDRTLGGLCDYVLGEAPAPVELPLEGAASLKAATIGVVLTYGLSDPLA